MKIEILSEFITLAKYRNYTAAAKELFLTQPGLSNHMTAMERELGFRVFERASKTFTLTPAGKELLRQSQSILDTWNKTLKKCSELSSMPAPIKILGLSEESLRQGLPQISHLPLAFVEADHNRSYLDLLLEGAVDVCLHDDCREMPGWEESLKKGGFSFVPCENTEQWAVSFMKTHPLASYDTLSAPDVAEYPIRINSGALFDVAKHSIEKMFPHGIEPLFVMDPVDSPEGLLEVDFENHVHICGLVVLQRLAEQRNDLVLHAHVEGLSLKVGKGLAYPSTPRAAELREFIESFLARYAAEDEGKNS